MQKSPRQSEISRRKQIKNMFFLKKLFMSFHGLFFFLVWLMVFKSLGLANLSNMWPEESTWCSLPQQKHMGILCRSTPVLLAQLQRSGLLSKTCIRAKQREILSISQEIKGSGCGMRKREHCKENIKRVNQDIHSTSLSSCQAPGTCKDTH